MSSTVLSAKHFNSIERAAHEFFTSRNYHGYPFQDFGLYTARDKITPEETRKRVTQWIDKLRYLNVVAVTFQYKDHFQGDGALQAEIQAEINEIVDRKSGSIPLTVEGFFLAVKSLNYQIEMQHLDGITDEFDQPYNFLQTLYKELAFFIADKHSEGSAGWFID